MSTKTELGVYNEMSSVNDFGCSLVRNVKVCGVSYTCATGDGDQLMWVQERSISDTYKPQAAGCSVDGLAALGAMKGCAVHIQDETCSVPRLSPETQERCDDNRTGYYCLANMKEADSTTREYCLSALDDRPGKMPKVFPFAQHACRAMGATRENAVMIERTLPFSNDPDVNIGLTTIRRTQGAPGPDPAPTSVSAQVGQANGSAPSNSGAAKASPTTEEAELASAVASAVAACAVDAALKIQGSDAQDPPPPPAAQDPPPPPAAQDPPPPPAAQDPPPPPADQDPVQDPQDPPPAPSDPAAQDPPAATEKSYACSWNGAPMLTAIGTACSAEDPCAFRRELVIDALVEQDLNVAIGNQMLPDALENLRQTKSKYYADIYDGMNDAQRKALGKRAGDEGRPKCVANVCAIERDAISSMRVNHAHWNADLPTTVVADADGDVFFRLPTGRMKKAVIEMCDGVNESPLCAAVATMQAVSPVVDDDDGVSWPLKGVLPTPVLKLTVDGTEGETAMAVDNRVHATTTAYVTDRAQTCAAALCERLPATECPERFCSIEGNRCVAQSLEEDAMVRRQLRATPVT